MVKSPEEYGIESDIFVLSYLIDSFNLSYSAYRVEQKKKLLDKLSLVNNIQELMERLVSPGKNIDFSISWKRVYRDIEKSRKAAGLAFYSLFRREMPIKEADEKVQEALNMMYKIEEKAWVFERACNKLYSEVNPSAYENYINYEEYGVRY